MIAVAAKGRRGLLGLLVLASLAQAALAAVSAFCVQGVFDTLLVGVHANGQAGVQPAPGALGLSGASIGFMAGIFGAFIAAALLTALLEVYRTWAGEKLGLGYIAEVRAALFETIMRVSPMDLSQKRQGSLLLPFVGDLSAIKKWVSQGLVRAISAGATFIFLITLLALRSSALAIAAASIVVCAAIAVLILSGPLTRAIREFRARRGAIANFVGTSIKSVATIQAFNRFSREAARLERRNAAQITAGLNLARIAGATSAIVHLAALALVAATLLVGVIEVSRGKMSVGAVAAAISIAGLLATAVRDLGFAFETWRRARVSYAKVGRMLTLSPSLPALDGARALRGEHRGLSLEKVSIAGLFEKVTAEALPGQVVNVEGASGAGKSTLLAVCARLRDPDTGRVRLNGRDLRRASASSLRRRVAIASAAVPLMPGSIAMNLRYSAPAASEEDVQAVVEICGLETLFARLPKGAQTHISGTGGDLSLGETQRLLIARALLGRPAVLILDDVDSHIGPEIAEQLAEALGDYEGTVLMTATSPACRAAADVNWRIVDSRLHIDPVPGVVRGPANQDSAAPDPMGATQ